MRIRYEIRDTDLVAFSEFHFDHSPSTRRRRRREWLGGPVLIALVMLALHDGDLFRSLISFLIAVLIWALWWPRYSRRSYRNRVRELYGEGRNAALLGTHEVVLEEDGLRAVGPTGDESKTWWESIERIAMSDDRLFIYLDAMHAIVIPRDTVTEGDFDDFARECQTRVPSSAKTAV